MASKLNFDGRQAQADPADCAALARMSLSQLLYHVLTGEGSPFQVRSSAKAA